MFGKTALRLTEEYHLTLLRFARVDWTGYFSGNTAARRPGSATPNSHSKSQIIMAKRRRKNKKSVGETNIQEDKQARKFFTVVSVVVVVVLVLLFVLYQNSI